MTQFKKVNQKTYQKIKHHLISDYSVTNYNPPDKSILSAFEIVTMFGKIPVHYYKNGTLLVQGDESNPIRKEIIKKISAYIIGFNRSD